MNEPKDEFEHDDLFSDYVTEEQDDANIDDSDSVQIQSFDLVSSPNDFNALTIVSYMEKGRIVVPFFQRNYVWDIYKASRLIESMVFGLPIPQIYLYAEGNVLKVIDGQQRLLSLYFFMKRKFPIKEKLIDIRDILSTENSIPDKILDNNKYFVDFNLKFKKSTPSILDGYNYNTLDALNEDYKSDFELRTIRNIVIKQIRPQGDRSMFEIFNRLNTGGMNLRPQEIRMSLYDSKFYRMLIDINKDKSWRKFLGSGSVSPYMQDIEVLLRGFAMLLWGSRYKPSLANFLNDFSAEAQKFDDEKVNKLKNIFEQFVKKVSKFSTVFKVKKKFNIALYEAVFVAACKNSLDGGDIKELSPKYVRTILKDDEFKEALQEGTTKKVNVDKRMRIAQNYI